MALPGSFVRELSFMTVACDFPQNEINPEVLRSLFSAEGKPAVYNIELFRGLPEAW